MTTLTEQELAVLNEQERKILEREQAASRGPWRSREFAGERGLWSGSLGSGSNLLTAFYRRVNADFITNARDDVPYLLAEVARLRVELAELERELDNPGQR